VAIITGVPGVGSADGRRRAWRGPDRRSALGRGGAGGPGPPKDRSQCSRRCRWHSRAAVVKTNHLLIKDAEAIGFTIGALGRLDPARERKNLAILIGWLAAGRITPHVSHRFPLAQAAEALTVVRERKVMGKAVLV